MRSKRRPYIVMKIRHSEGGTHETRGECTEKKAYAMYMLDVVADLPPLDQDATPEQVAFRAAADEFLAATEKMRMAAEMRRRAEQGLAECHAGLAADGDKVLDRLFAESVTAPMPNKRRPRVRP